MQRDDGIVFIKKSRMGNKAGKNSESRKSDKSWESFVDESSGEKYYTNKLTRQTTWTNPKFRLDEAIKTLERAEAGVPRGDDENVAGEGGATESTTAEWTAYKDDDTGEIYFTHSVNGKTTWSKPKEPFVIGEGEDIRLSEIESDEESGSESEDLPKKTGEKVSAKKGPTGSPAAVWTAYKDDDTAEIYFTHSVNGKTTWSKPKEPFVIGKGEDIRLSEIDSDEESAGESEGSPKKPDQWTAYKDDDSGEVYFTNSLKRCTTWTVPQSGFRVGKGEAIDVDALKVIGDSEDDGSSRETEAPEGGGNTVGPSSVGDQTKVKVEGTAEGAVGKKKADTAKKNKFSFVPSIGALKAAIKSRKGKNEPTETDAKAQPKCSQKKCDDDVYLDGLCLLHFKDRHVQQQKVYEKRRQKFFGD